MRPRQLRRRYVLGGRTHEVDVVEEKDRLRVHVDGVEATDLARVVRPFPGGADLVVTHGDGRSRAVVLREGDTVHVSLRGRVYRLAIAAAREQDAGSADVASIEAFVASPMTGVVRQVAATPGRSFAAGETLVVVEAMKMEFAVEAPRAVVVAGVNVKPGERVEIGQVLVQFEEPAA